MKFKSCLALTSLFLLGTMPMVYGMEFEQNSWKNPSYFHHKKQKNICLYSNSFSFQTQKEKYCTNQSLKNEISKNLKEEIKSLKGKIFKKPLKYIAGFAVSLAGGFWWFHNEQAKELNTAKEKNYTKWQESSRKLLAASIYKGHEYQSCSFSLGTQKNKAYDHDEEEVAKVSNDISFFKEEKERISKLFALSPLNWALKKELLKDLDNYQRGVLIARLFLNGSNHMEIEAFEAASKEYGEAKKDIESTTVYYNSSFSDSKLFLIGIDHMIVNAYKIDGFNESSVKIITGIREEKQKRYIVIASKLQSVAQYQLAYFFEKNRDEYKKKLSSIIEGLEKDKKNYDPRDPFSHINLGILKLKLIETDKNKDQKEKLMGEAVLHINEARKKRPNDPMLLDLEGLYHMENGDFSKALSKFNAAVKLSANNTEDLNKNGTHLEKTLSSKNIAFLYNRSRLHTKMKSYKEAYEDIKTVYDSQIPRKCDLLYQYTLATIDCKDCEKAKKIWDTEYFPSCGLDSNRPEDVSSLREGKVEILKDFLRSNCNYKDI